jgi:hypothetical protein
MAAMVARRWLADARARRDTRDHAAVVAILLGVSNDLSSCRPMLASVAGVQALLHVLVLTKGAEQARVLDVARRLWAPSALRRAAKARSTQHRLLAVEALGFFDLKESQQTLVHALNDIDGRVRVAALKSLASIGAPPPVQWVLTSIARAGRGRQSALADALRTIANVSPKTIIQALAIDTAPSSQVLLIDAAVSAGLSAVRPRLLQLAECDSLEVQCAAIQALAVLACPDALGVIERALRADDWRVRLRAVEAAGKLCLLDCGDAVVQLLDDDVWWVRLRAQEAIASLSEASLGGLQRVRLRGVRGAVARVEVAA